MIGAPHTRNGGERIDVQREKSGGTCIEFRETCTTGRKYRSGSAGTQTLPRMHLAHVTYGSSIRRSVVAFVTVANLFSLRQDSVQ